MEHPVPIEELLRHSGWLRGLAGRLVEDPSRADDLVQDTWIAALRRPPLPGDSPRPWLTRVLGNLARNQRREERTREGYERGASEERQPATPEAIAHEVEAQRLLADAVAALPEPGRSVIVLGYFRGLDSVRVGAELGLPAATVRWHHAQALTKLRARLDRKSGGRAAWVAWLAPLARHGERARVRRPWLSSTPLTTVVALGVALGGSLLWWIRTEERASAVESDVTLGRTSRVGGMPDSALLRPPTMPAQRALVSTGPVVHGHGVTGRVFVDGRPTALKLELRFPGDQSEPLFTRSNDEGLFEFGPRSQPWGALHAPGYRLANQLAAETVQLPAPLPVELRLLGGPMLTGRFLQAHTREPIPVPPGLQGYNAHYEFHWEDYGHRSEAGVFATDDEGRFRLSLADEYEHKLPRVRLLVELYDLGRAVVEVPPPGSEGLDLGDLEFEACRAVPFRLLDAGGGQVDGGFAQHLDWAKYAQADALGAGAIPCVPTEGARVRFGSPRHRDVVRLVLPGDSPTLVLERTNVLALEITTRDGAPLPELRLALSPHQELFLDTGDAWHNLVVFEGHAVASAIAPEAPYFHVTLEAGSSGRVLLRDLRPELPFQIELSAAGTVVGERTCVLGEQEWQELAFRLP